MPLSLEMLLLGGLVAGIQKRIYLGCSFTMGFGCRPLIPLLPLMGGHFGTPSLMSHGSSYVLSSGRTCGGSPDPEEDTLGGRLPHWVQPEKL